MSNVEISEWDAAEDLADDRDVLEFLKAVYAEGDALTVRMAVASVIKAMSAWPSAQTKEESA